MMAEQGASTRSTAIRISGSGQTKQPASVIHSRTLTGSDYLKLPTIAAERVRAAGDEPDNISRREFLTRRPSYRKLFNDLTSDQQSYVVSKIEDNSSDGQLTQDSNENSNDGAPVIGMSGQTFQMVSQEDGSESGLPSLTVTSGNVPTSGSATVIQYTQGPDGGQYFIPVQQVSPSGVVSFPQGIMVAAGGMGLNNSQEESSRKRELRLLKNKEAAKECRRKKKEYVKCLENRVAVLENQNKTLIEELKSLKELYCQKEVHS